MKITLQSVKVCKFASEETTCFEARLFVDGRFVCHVSNDGHGGCHRYSDYRAIDALAAYAASLPEERVTCDGKSWFSLQPTCDSLVDNALTRWQTARDFARMLKKRTLFIRGRDCLGYAGLIRNPRAHTPDDVFLNDMPLDEAVDRVLALASEPAAALA